ncbi:MAG: hypothetical protein OXF20_06195 [Gammaproteobacteria bacterium]|nr:hypothetical protein [Gammaproteobacteria bacterium]
MCNFDEAEYRHRFAAWAASTAAMAANIGGRLGSGFDVRTGKKMIEDSELRKDLLPGWDAALFNSSDDLDEWHRKKRYLICEISKRYREKHPFYKNKKFPQFTHGIAAKLINVYMKALFLGSVQDCMQEKNRKKQKLIHPPIDATVLEGLKNKIKERRENGNPIENEAEVQRAICKLGRTGNPVNKAKSWTALTSDEYQEIIDQFRHLIGNEGLWTIEKYWPGHQ